MDFHEALEVYNRTLILYFDTLVIFDCLKQFFY